ncbi:hypothetical protein ES702_00120 [subsurface metagenome]
MIAALSFYGLGEVFGALRKKIVSSWAGYACREDVMCGKVPEDVKLKVESLQLTRKFADRALELLESLN